MLYHTYQVQPKSVPSASARQESAVVAPGEQATPEPEGIPAEELEAKLLSVRKALERFDDVKVWSRVPVVNVSTVKLPAEAARGWHLVELAAYDCLSNLQGL